MALLVETRPRVACVLALAGVMHLLSCAHKEQPEAEAASNVTVEVGTVIRTTLYAHLDAYGVVEPSPAMAGHPAGIAPLTAAVTGIVRRVLATEGQAVHAGELLVALDERIAQARVVRAQSSVHFAEQTLARNNELLAQQNTSQRRVEESEQALAIAKADLDGARAELDLTHVRSPIDGIVSRLYVTQGQSVDANEVVAEILDRNRLVIAARVPSEDIGRVDLGQTAYVMATRTDDSKSVATVSYIGPSVDPKTGTVLVRLALQSDAGLRPGQFIKSSIVVEEHADRLAVPRKSIFTSTQGDSTLSIVKDGVATQMEVQRGIRDNDLVEVEGDGLQAGMSVVTSGSYALPKQTKVNVTSSTRKKHEAVP